MEEEEAVLLLLSPEDEPPAALASALSVALPAKPSAEMPCAFWKA